MVVSVAGGDVGDRGTACRSAVVILRTAVEIDQLDIDPSVAAVGAVGSGSPPSRTWPSARSAPRRRRLLARIQKFPASLVVARRPAVLPAAAAAVDAPTHAPNRRLQDLNAAENGDDQ